MRRQYSRQPASSRMTTRSESTMPLYAVNAELSLRKRTTGITAPPSAAIPRLMKQPVVEAKYRTSSGVRRCNMVLRTMTSGRRRRVRVCPPKAESGPVLARHASNTQHEHPAAKSRHDRQCNEQVLRRFYGG